MNAKKDAEKRDDFLTQRQKTRKSYREACVRRRNAANAKELKLMWIERSGNPYIVEPPPVVRVPAISHDGPDDAHLPPHMRRRLKDDE